MIKLKNILNNKKKTKKLHELTYDPGHEIK